MTGRATAEAAAFRIGLVLLSATALAALLIIIGVAVLSVR